MAGDRKVHDPSSFRRSLATAAAFLIGFYVFAALVAAGLFALAIVPWATDLPQNVWISAGCLLSGLAIVRGIVPRRLPFDPPGPRLERAEEPELHRVIDEVAAGVHQAVPDELYLAADVNAGVGETGGLLGLGRRRVMTIGLPLLDCMTVGQLRAVLAHEFGHYGAGDTRLTPWFLRTYDAITRTVVNLQARESMWARPFTWYATFFLRRTRGIHRRQEFTADEMAVRAGGREAAASGLREVHEAGLAFEEYWHAEYAPVLGAGARASLLDGFRRFRSAPRVRARVQAGFEAELAGTESDPYDTHPPLGERLAAIERIPERESGGRPGDDAPALGLLSDPDDAERRLLVALFGDEVARLEPIRWEDVPEQVIVTGWRHYVEPVRGRLADLTAAQIPDIACTQLERLGEELAAASGGSVPPDGRRGYAASVLDTAFALSLHESGWTVEAGPGEPVRCVRGDRDVEPFGVSADLADGDLTRAEWVERCELLGIADLPLGGAAVQAEAL